MKPFWTSVLALTTCAWANGVAADTELNIVTNTGYVALTAADDWTVLQMQTKMPVATAVFQLPNDADRGTSDSTNLIVVLFEHGSDTEKSMYEAPIQPYGAEAPIVESFAGWKIYRQQAPQGNTMYSIWDAKNSNVAVVSISVRLAWPHLASNSPAYAADMDRTFRAFLASIRGGIGEYKLREGEALHRPAVP